MSSHLPAVVVALTVLLLIVVMGLVGRARGRYGVKAPATTGHEDFERVFRAQMNTIESAVMFLPALWLGTTYGSPQIAGICGLIWVLTRFWYAFAYAQAAGKRAMPFLLSSLAIAATFAVGVWGLLRHLMGY
ncbi:MAG: MAPEG family protein [Rhodanobacteraceae bacterium]|nr:MAPEG family protein [Rhodanobacteraceae bacterium]